MNKIGITFYSVDQGAKKNHASAGAKEWESQIHSDHRNYVNGIVKDNSSTIEYITFGENVAFIHIVKLSSYGRSGDGFSAILTVPATIEIKGEELVSLMEEAKDALEQTIKDYEEIDKKFAKDFPPKQHADSCRPSADVNSDNKFAVRYYGKGQHYTLEEILGSLFQDYYSEYKAVFLCEQGITQLEADKVKDISDSKIEEYVWLEYPKNIKNDIRIKVNDDFFEGSKKFPKGTTVKLKYLREGYEPIDKNFTLTEKTTSPECENLPWKCRVKKNWFKVVDKDTDEPHSSAKIVINGTEVDGNNTFSEKDLQQKFRLEVSCNRYNTSTINLNFSSIPFHYKIELEKKRHDETFIVTNGAKTKENEDVKVIVKNTKSDYTSSPLKGYNCIGDRQLSYAPYYISKKVAGIMAAIAVLLLGFTFAGGYCLGKNAAKKKVNEEEVSPMTNNATKESHTSNKEKPEVFSLDSTELAFLNKDTLDFSQRPNNSPKLLAFFNMLNNGQKDSIPKWDKVLKGEMENWNEIKEAIKKRSNTSNPYITNPNDSTITISRYINQSNK